MTIYWLVSAMCLGCAVALLGGLGLHIIENYNGRRLEAYCRLKRKPQLFGEVLDWQDAAFAGSLYVVLLGLVAGSLAAGAWLTHRAAGQLDETQIQWRLHWTHLASWICSWLAVNMLFALWLPRLIVRENTSMFLYYTWPFWKVVATITRPFVLLGESFRWLGQRLSDVPEDDDIDEQLVQDDIRTMVQAAQRDGVLSEDVPDMIQGVMRLDTVEVAKIMTPRSVVDAINVEQSWEEIVRQAVACHRTRIPIYRNTIDDCIGILFVKDLLVLLADPDTAKRPTSVEPLLRKPWFVPGNKTVDELLRVFLHNRNHMAIVVDEFQQVLGVVTIEDALEEIVGEIADELDLDEDSQISYNPESHQVEADGKVPVESIGKLMGIELPQSDDYDTIGGLIIHRLSEIPKEGTQLEVSGLRITVLKATKRLVQRVRLEVVKA